MHKCIPHIHATFTTTQRRRPNARGPPRVDEPWAIPLGLNHTSTTTTADGSLQVADVFSCVRCLSDAAASVPLITYRASDAGRVRLSGGRLPSLLDRPAPATTQSDLVGTLMAHLALWGNAYLGKFRGEDGHVEQLGCLHPDQVEVKMRAGAPSYIVSDPETGRQSEHGVDDVVHVKGMSVDGLRGLSPIKQARLAVNLSRGLGEFAEAFVRNGARPSGIVKLPSGSAEQMKSTVEGIEDRHGGARNAHRVAVLKGDVEWIPMAGSLDDLQFIEQRNLSTQEICRIFRIPPWMIGAPTSDSMTYANTEQHALSFVTWSLRPWLVRIEKAISTDPDLCPGALYVEFLLDSLLRADSKTRAEIYALALDPEKGWMNRDEIRRLENLEKEGAA